MQEVSLGTVLSLFFWQLRSSLHLLLPLVIKNLSLAQQKKDCKYIEVTTKNLYIFSGLKKCSNIFFLFFDEIPMNFRFFKYNLTNSVEYNKILIKKKKCSEFRTLFLDKIV